MTRLSVFYTHPIQYLVPLWRRLAAEPGVDLKVYYFSDASVRGGIDAGFGIPVAWDVPLLEGYEHEFLERDAERRQFRQARVRNLQALFARDETDSVLVGGYVHPFERQVILGGKRMGIRTMLRGELTDAPRPGRTLWRRLARSTYLRHFYRHVDAFCVLGRNGRDHLVRRRISEDRIFSSPYAIDTEYFERQLDKWTRLAARRELAIPDDLSVLLFSGKLIQRKQPMLLTRALKLVSDPGKFHLIVLGDGPQMEDMKREASAVLGDRLTIPGFVNQGGMAPYFAAADVLVLPSEFETWGLVVNEAMTCSLPVVTSSKVGCHPDLVIPGTTGYVFPSGDAHALARQLDTLAASREATRVMGESARDHIRSYSTEASAKGVLMAARAANESNR